MTVVTRYQILRLKCTKFDFGWGSAPDPAGGANSAPPDLLAGFKGPTSKGERGGDGRVGQATGVGYLHCKTEALGNVTQFHEIPRKSSGHLRNYRRSHVT